LPILEHTSPAVGLQDAVDEVAEIVVLLFVGPGRKRVNAEVQPFLAVVEAIRMFDQECVAVVEL
jgi:hypothetical protein